MISLLRRPPSVRAERVGRVVLRLEGLEGRATPSSDTVPPSGPPVAQDGQGNQAPVITNFTASAIGGGWYLISGTVLDERPGGLTVTFGGTVTTMQGQTTTTAANGSFSVLVQLQTNGSDTGYITASTVDDRGVASNVPSYDVDPT